MNLRGLIKKLKINTLRSFITLTVSTTVAISLLCAGAFFYYKSANILTKNYKDNIIQKLYQTNAQVEDQINLINSLYPLIMSNSIIRENLDKASAGAERPIIEKRLEIERQLSYLLISSYLWNEKFIDAVYIFDASGNHYKMSLYKNGSNELANNQEVFKNISPNTSSLEIKTLNGNDDSLYFARNINSMFTGDYIATIIININQDTFINSYSQNTDDNWLIYLYNDNMQVLNNQKMIKYSTLLAEHLSAIQKPDLFQEITLHHTDFFMAEKQLQTSGITSVVAAPKEYLFSELHTSLKAFLLIFIIIISITLICAIILSRAITKPIEKMIAHVKSISQGKQLPNLPGGLYSEFNEFAQVFDQMLKQLDIYYNDIFQKQLLLKNAEIKALQAQMDPHFLFNVLDTIAWKAQMSNEEDIYQMIISLGELLRANTLSKEKDFISLQDELAYVKFYIYLQQMRFEDKYSVEIQVDPILYPKLIPRFCIQPLVENAITHGLEPKRGFGKLRINIILQDKHMEVIVIDNGVGFNTDIDIQNIHSSSEDSHTHIGLKNLDKRLSLLYDSNCHLVLKSIPDKYTAISFKIPLEKEVL